ncbi:AraC family transcriptional regulator [Pseudonocardia sp. NPDC049635]|uniref:helix-turn-helix domain-containing protein n=1 Tax=Pseudonocardia sp. NPDC049635 TaxID=3155506 RepID=UPI0033D19806
MLLPAGLRNQVTTPAGSILLPLGSRPAFARPAHLDPHVIHLPAESEDFLLSTVVASLTLLRPAGHDSHLVVTSFHRYISFASGQGCHPVSTPVRQVLDTLIRDPSDPRGLSDWGSLLGVNLDELRETFTAEAGSTFPVWRARRRMTHARTLLAGGDPPSIVARRTGYTRPANFTRASTTAHGVSPRQYQQQTRRLEGTVNVPARRTSAPAHVRRCVTGRPDTPLRCCGPRH